MAGSLAELIVTVVANTSQFNGDMAKAKKSVTDFNADLKTFGTNMTKYATVPILAIGTAMVKTAIDIEKQKTAFGVLLKDTEKGNQLFTDLQKLASKTPLQLNSITKSAQQLLAAGSTMNELNDTITMLGDIALGDAAKLGTLTNAYSKMQTKGKATMEELNMVTEAGVPILQALADSLGVSVAEVFNLSSQGKIAFTDVKDAMASLTSETGQFNKGMEKLSETTGGKLSTALDNIQISASEFGVLLLPQINEILEATTELFRGFSELDDGTKKAILTFAGLTAGIAPAILAVQKLGAAFKVLASPAGGIGLALIAVSAIITGIQKIEAANLLNSEKNFKGLEEVTGRTAKELNQINKEFALMVFQGNTLAESEKEIQKQFGITNEELVSILAISKDLYDSDLEYYQTLDAVINKTNTKRESTVKVIEDTTEAVVGLSDKQLEAYKDQNEAVQAILEANKSEIALLDEQIESITALSLADSTYRDDQQTALALLKAQKQAILDEELEEKQSALDAELDAIKEKNKQELEDAKELKDQKIELKAEEAQFVQDTAEALSTIISNFNTVEMAEIEAKSEAQTTAIDTKLAASIAALDEELLGTDEYNAQVTALEEKAAAESLAIEKAAAYKVYAIELEQFKLKQALALSQIAIDTAIGVAKVYGQTGIFGLAAQVPVIAMGVAQAAVVASEPAPTKPALATGAIIAGSQRGVDVTVAEGGNDELILGGGSQGEAILNKFADKINERNGGGSNTIVVNQNNMLNLTDSTNLAKAAEILYEPLKKVAQRRGE